MLCITDNKQGNVIAICDCKVDTGRGEVKVKWDNDNTNSSHRILDLKCERTGVFYYYYDHLPVLGKGTILFYLVLHKGNSYIHFFNSHKSIKLEN